MTYADLSEYMTISIEGVAGSFANDIDEFVGLMTASGVSQSEIKSILANDLKQRGTLFNSLKNKSNLAIRNGVESASNIATGIEYKNAGIERLRWVSAGNNVCPDCADRAGVIGTQEYFDLIGNPKSGFSVCGQNCQCQLVPVEYVQEGDVIKKVKPDKNRTTLSTKSSNVILTDYKSGLIESAKLRKDKLYTEKEKRYISDYFKGDYDKVNKMLRGQDEFDIDWENAAAGIESYLKKSPNFVGTVNRYEIYDTVKLREEFKKLISEYHNNLNGIINKKEFLSTSANPLNPFKRKYDNVFDEDFAIKYTIKSKTGTIANGASKFTATKSSEIFNNKDEAEILFNRGTRFKIKSIKEIQSNKFHIQLEEI